MDYTAFRTKAVLALPVGKVFKNPGGGTTTIVSLTEDNIYYQRGRSKIGIKYETLFQTYQHFRGKAVSSRQLKAYAPKVYDSKNGGNSGNATFLYLVLREMKVVDHIQGRGVSNNPFYVMIPG